MKRQKLRMVAMAVAFLGLALVACSPGADGPHLVSSAHAADPYDPLYPPLSADAHDGYVHEYY